MRAVGARSISGVSGVRPMPAKPAPLRMCAGLSPLAGSWWGGSGPPGREWSAATVGSGPAERPAGRARPAGGGHGLGYYFFSASPSAAVIAVYAWSAVRVPVMTVSTSLSS